MALAVATAITSTVAAAKAPLRAAPAAAAVPLAMSEVSLSGDLADAQARNQEVLMSLNMTRWACHFTTTANLTKCQSTSVPWQT